MPTRSLSSCRSAFDVVFGACLCGGTSIILQFERDGMHHLLVCVLMCVYAHSVLVRVSNVCVHVCAHAFYACCTLRRLLMFILTHICAPSARL